MKKIFLIFLMCISFSLFPTNVKAKTLREVYAELDILEKEIQDNKASKEKTKEEIQTAANDINRISAELVQLDKDVLTSKDKQIELSDDVESKKDEIQSLLKYLQISSGENEYLEYMFGATSVTDFIHRNAVVEGLTTHNDDLINEMKQAIEDEKKLVEELNAKEIEMNNRQEDLRKLKISLYANHEALSEEGLTIEEEIESTREMIDLYKDTCSLDEEISVCSNKLPPDTSFWRPLTSGYVTSEWGYRWHPVYNKYVLHAGIDLGVGGETGTSIYASAAGKVSYIKYRAYCGGNQVYINHRVNGETFTTVYMHMLNMYVSVGDIVSKKTVIGTVGGTATSTPWDHCSTGAHLHFGIYIGMTTSSSASVNPRIYTNFPSYRVNFYDRTTRY